MVPATGRPKASAAAVRPADGRRGRAAQAAIAICVVSSAAKRIGASLAELPREHDSVVVSVIAADGDNWRAVAQAAGATVIFIDAEDAPGRSPDAPPAPLVLLSDAAPEAMLPALIRTGAHGVLSPQADGRALLRAARAVAGGEVWLPRRLLGPLLDQMARSADENAGGADAGITRREQEVMALMRQGLSNKAIAARLMISINTVKKHLHSVFAKRGLLHRRQVAK